MKPEWRNDLIFKSYFILFMCTMGKIIFPVVMMWLASCGQKAAVSDTAGLQELAIQYVRLGLTIGQYDADFVDAYYGPDSLKPLKAPSGSFPKDSLIGAVSE